MSLFSRWQQRKNDVAEQEQEQTQTSTSSPVESDAERLESPSPASGSSHAEATEPAPIELPDPETIEQGGSFADFMQPGVDPLTRKAALKALWKQPQYNVLDGLTEYSLDYAAQPKLESEVAAQLIKGIFRHVTAKEEAEAEAEAEQAAAKSENAVIEPTAQNDDALQPPTDVAADGQNDPKADSTRHDPSAPA